MDVLRKEIERRWRAMFSALHAGLDVTPSERLRTEGMMEALVLVDGANEAELSTAMAHCYLEITGQHFSELFAEDWQAYFPFPQIPAMGQRAPVYPSTSE